MARPLTARSFAHSLAHVFPSLSLVPRHPCRRPRDADATARRGGEDSVLDLDKLDTQELMKLQGEELERFESYRRSAIPKASMKKVSDRALTR